MAVFESIAGAFGMGSWGRVGESFNAKGAKLSAKVREGTGGDVDDGGALGEGV